MTIKDYCSINDAQISEADVKGFERATGISGDKMFDTIHQLLKKYNVQPMYAKRILEDPDCWFGLRKNPEEVVKRFVKKDGHVDGCGLSAVLAQD